MMIERSRWVRGLLVTQPLVAWPCSWMLWLGGSTAGLVLAVVVLWGSALTCVFAIVVPVRRQERGTCERR